MNHAISTTAHAARPIIEMSKVVKIYKTPAGEFSALRGIDAAFWQGEFISVVGKSGSGKSTLINMITGIDHPTSGSVRVVDRLIHEVKEGQMAEWRGVNLGIVFQFFQLLPMLTLLENVVLPMDFCHRYAPDQREPRALELLGLVGLADLADKMPAELSGGQQQSAAIARALANDPPILVADEPTGNLDSRTAEAVFQIFCDLARAGKTVIMVTHDKTLSERTTRTLLICDGELIDDRVARAFPTLPHRTLLGLTKTLRPQPLSPGQPVLIGPSGFALAVIASGTAEAVLLEDTGKNIGCLPLCEGEVLTLAELESMPGITISLRAADDPTNLLVLDAPDFENIFPKNSPVRAQLERSTSDRATQLASIWHDTHQGLQP